MSARFPQGTYTVGNAYDTRTHGPHVMRLTPSAGTNTLGRDGFLIHGDNARHDASRGLHRHRPRHAGPHFAIARQAVAGGALRRGQACALAAATLMLAAAGTYQPSALLAQIHSQGAKAVVSQLAAGDGAGWDQVLGQVEAGSKPWLDVGLALKPGADAGSGEALSVSMATALLSNPEDVLRSAVPAFGEKTICSMPLIEPSPQQAASYNTKARMALARVGIA